jgi:putative acid phosphatase of HAD superfamily subfamily IIIB
MRCGARISSLLTAALVAGAVSIAMAISVAPNPASAFECPASPSLPSADGSQPPNLGVLKLQLTDYKCFGAYDRDIAKALNEAKAFVEERTARAAPDERLAIVLDIDETSVSNWENLVTDDFGFFQLGECKLQPKEPCGFDHWISDHDPPPITPTLELFTMAKAKNLKIIFISARREEQRSDTVRNLTAAGYKDWDDLVLKQPGDPQAVAAYKTRARALAEDKHKVRIIANIGDQHSDLSGGHAERTFKVPNPFYYVP